MSFFRYLPLLTLLLIAIWYGAFYKGDFTSLWIKPDREAAALLKAGKVEAALKRYENPLNIGAVYYKRGAFKKALSVYETLGSKEAFYNRGNTLVMLGKYKEAIKAYTLALEADPDYKEARENMRIAKQRQALLDRQKGKGDEKGTGGQLKADKIVFDNKNSKGASIEKKSKSSEANAAWLDRLETSPAKFLVAKFAYQLQMKKSEK